MIQLSLREYVQERWSTSHWADFFPPASTLFLNCPSYSKKRCSESLVKCDSMQLCPFFRPSFFGLFFNKSLFVVVCAFLLKQFAVHKATVQPIVSIVSSNFFLSLCCCIVSFWVDNTHKNVSIQIFLPSGRSCNCWCCCCSSLFLGFNKCHFHYIVQHRNWGLFYWRSLWLLFLCLRSVKIRWMMYESK